MVSYYGLDAPVPTYRGTGIKPNQTRSSAGFVYQLTLRVRKTIEIMEMKVNHVIC